MQPCDGGHHSADWRNCARGYLTLGHAILDNPQRQRFDYPVRRMLQIKFNDKSG